jgi:hypothetical protein
LTFPDRFETIAAQLGIHHMANKTNNHQDNWSKRSVLGCCVRHGRNLNADRSAAMYRRHVPGEREETG